MVHDFATAERETPPRQRGVPQIQGQQGQHDKRLVEASQSDEKLKIARRSAIRRSAAEPDASGPPKVVSQYKVIWLKLLAVGVLLGLIIVAFRVFSAGEPVIDATPDSEASLEYESAMRAYDSADTVSETPHTEPAPKREVNKSAVVASDGVTSVGTLPSEKNALPQPGVGSQETPAEQHVSKYEFYETLPNAAGIPLVKGAYITVEEAANQQPLYLLQAASFREPVEAERLLRKLRRSKLAASLARQVSASGDYWYAVNVGPFKEARALDAARKELIDLGITPLKRRVTAP